MADLSDSVNWFEIDNSNNKASPNGWPEGMMPSGVNDSARADKGALKRFWDRINPVQTVAQSGGLWTFTTSNPAYPASYVDGEIYSFKAANVSVGNDQFQVNTLGSKPIWKRVSSGTGFVPIIAQDIVNPLAPQLIYNAALNGGAGAFVLLNPFVPITGDGAGGISTVGPVYSTGTAGGFVFYDHSDPSISWSWYADAGSARLFNSSTSNWISIDGGGALHTTGEIHTGGNLFLAGGIYINGIMFANTDGTTLHIYDAAGGPALHLQAATNYYDADTHVFRNNAGSINQLAVAGGNLTISGNYFLFAGAGGNVNATGGPLIYADNNNTVYKQGIGNGLWMFQNYAGANVASISAIGVMNAAQYNLSGVIFATHDATTNAIFDASGAPAIHLQAAGSFYDADGHHFRNNASVEKASIDSAGSFVTQGNITAGGYLSSLGRQTRAGSAGATTGNYFNIEWRSPAHLWIDNVDQGALVLEVGGTINCANINATGGVTSNGGFFTQDGGGTYQFGLYHSGPGNVINFAPNHYLEYTIATGQLAYTASVPFWLMRQSDLTCWNQLGPTGGNGAYFNISDRRIKENIEPFTSSGLAAIVQLNPVSFNRINIERREVGFIAQDVEAVLPDAVQMFDMPAGAGTETIPTLVLTDTVIVAALVNAVKELHTRLSQLETR